MSYKAVTLNPGQGGWGGPLTVQATDQCKTILCVTAGGGIHPVAQKIADMTGGVAVDGYKNNVPDQEVLVAVVDCGGTARCGVYPKKGIFTVNLNPVGAVGPLATFIKEDIYVSGVTEKDVVFAGEGTQGASKAASGDKKTAMQERKEAAKEEAAGSANFITRLGIAIGKVVNKFFAAGRDSIEMVIKNILPFMAFTSTLLGIISASGLGNVIAKTISPLCSTLPGMLAISFICALPFLSPVLGPGAVIAQLVGVLLGDQIGAGAIPAQYALPALFAIDAQVGGDFVPVGLSLGEAESSTIELGVPAVLYSRVITGPLAVVIAFVFSMGLYPQ
ncbi:MAG: PTS glucitol/sorbitol transporter subunit IIB [Anaerostipes sp.]|uniref:PTS glucitol/sorbitol transporter subunit IIB n=1 Tax=Anaerostipes sp. 992a TaxID=1261637 RepID=UPI0009511B86|nr:PTS glucitol/sorbitol transporter subunit IIB [Anaerostipes sp. 992a]MCI5951362.1 PTS glucitol/sorbitol transporter subunit IIB [Anaerostipes sp.]MDD5969008.1 PTS glucitol/sorbitol transporter subunit IIB [Anaerostipes sp.]OLR63007.1 PTS sorbitol transporter subunit IIB [Anaerostipes sp. 992a]